MQLVYVAGIGSCWSIVAVSTAISVHGLHQKRHYLSQYRAVFGRLDVRIIMHFVVHPSDKN